MLFKVSNLIENQLKLAIVKKNTIINDALAIMLMNDFSQLPVIDDEGRLIGVFSEETFVRTSYNINLKIPLKDLTVDNCMATPVTVTPDDDIFKALDLLQSSYAIVVVKDAKPIGILTNYDTGHFFREISEGLIYIEDIEVLLRQYIETILNTEKMMSVALIRAFGINKQDNSRPAMEFDKLDFYDHIQLITTNDNWTKFEAFFSPKDYFIDLMDKVRLIRNQLVHFRGRISRLQLLLLKQGRDWLSNRPKSEPSIRIHLATASLQATSGIEVNAPNTSDITKIKYILENYRRKEEIRVKFDFDFIENVLSIKLPEIALEHRSWWANDLIVAPHSIAWISAGWVVEEVDFILKHVIFRVSSWAVSYSILCDIRTQFTIQNPNYAQIPEVSFNNIFAFESGKHGYSFRWIIGEDNSLYTWLQILFVDRPLVQEKFDQLINYRGEIEEILGVNLVWDLPALYTEANIFTSIPLPLNDPLFDKDTAVKWGVNMMSKFIRAFMPYIQEEE